jgi:hypothetical protein
MELISQIMQQATAFRHAEISKCFLMNFATSNYNPSDKVQCIGVWKKMAENIFSVPRRNFMRWSMFLGAAVAGSSTSVRALERQSSNTNLNAVKILSELNAERECSKLCANYSKAIDQRDIKLFQALFAPEINVVLGSDHYETREAFLEAIRKRPAERVSAHVCTNIIIDVIDENNASGICYLMLFRSDCEAEIKSHAENLSPRMIGIYFDKFQKLENKWKFRERILRPIMSTNTDILNACP